MYLDPDYRKDPVKNADGTYKPFCVRCQKTIDDVSKAVLVTVNYDTMQVVLGGKELMGRNCYRVISKRGD